MSLTLPPAKSPGTACWYAKLELPDEDRALLDKWLADADIAGSRIAEALKGYGINSAQVGNHRRDHVIGKNPCR